MRKLCLLSAFIVNNRLFGERQAFLFYNFQTDFLFPPKLVLHQSNSIYPLATRRHTHTHTLAPFSNRPVYASGKTYLHFSYFAFRNPHAAHIHSHIANLTPLSLNSILPYASQHYISNTNTQPMIIYRSCTLHMQQHTHTRAR